MSSAEELNKLQDNQELAEAFLIISVGVFGYLTKSLVQLAGVVNVTGEWLTGLRLMAMVTLGALLISMSTGVIVEQESTLEIRQGADDLAYSVDSIATISAAFVQLIIAWFALKNALGNLIFKVLVGTFGVVSTVDIANMILSRKVDSDLDFITWMLWAVALIGIGVSGLVTGEEA